MKYLVYKNDSGRECGFVFPERRIHADVAKYFDNVISAGFCDQTPAGIWDAWGESESLGLCSRPNDACVLSQSSPDNFKSGERVLYAPTHAKGDLSHPDCEQGTVSSTSARFVFVRFDRPVSGVGCFEVEGQTPKACFPIDLVHIPQRQKPQDQMTDE